MERSPLPPDLELAGLPDPDLLVVIAAGRDAALAVLYDRYGRLVYSLAVSILNDSAEAEEVIQDVFNQIWSKASAYRPEQGKVVTWLASITRHRAIDLLRRRGARPEGHTVDWDESGVDEAPSESRTEELVELAQQQWRVRQAIAMLPPDQRRALAMAFFKGYTHEQIAAETGDPLGTVKTRIRLALIKLRQMLLSEMER